MFDFGTEFFSNENYAKHLVRTLLLSKYANELSGACQGQAEEGEEELWWKAGEAQNPLSAGGSQLRAASISRMWTQRCRVHSKVWVCPAQAALEGGVLPPGPQARPVCAFQGWQSLVFPPPRKAHRH